jgi:hypothetical protein
MRTEIQLLMQIDEYREWMNDDNIGYQGEANAEGMIAGFKAGIRLTKEGKTEQQIIDYIHADDMAYSSHGDDDQDAYQSGFSCALWWAADQYEWIEDGTPVLHEDSILKW